MKRPALLIALLLVIVANVMVLGGVAANRRGEPVTTTWLTERELPVTRSSYGTNRENSGLSLNLTWNRYEADFSWLNATKMTELGFEVPRPATGEDSRRYRRPLPRKAFVVLEYDGPQWQAFHEQKLAERARLDGRQATGEITPEAAKRMREQIDRRLETASRLFAVDAGLDPVALRERYPEPARHLIVKAKIRMNTWLPRSDTTMDPNQQRGTIGALLPASVHVPLALQKTLPAPPSDPGTAHLLPKPGSPLPQFYRVELRYGARYEPWVARIDVREE